MRRDPVAEYREGITRLSSYEIENLQGATRWTRSVDEEIAAFLDWPGVQLAAAYGVDREVALVETAITYLSSSLSAVARDPALLGRGATVRENARAANWIVSRLQTAPQKLTDLQRQATATGFKGSVKNRLIWLERAGRARVDEDQLVHAGAAPLAPLVPISESAPHFEMYYSTRSAMNEDQRHFYDQFRLWFLDGTENPPASHIHLSYWFALINDVYSSQFQRLEPLLTRLLTGEADQFMHASEPFAVGKLRRYAKRWLTDCALDRGDYVVALRMVDACEVALFRKLSQLAPPRQITVEEAFTWASLETPSNFAATHVELITSKVAQRLDEEFRRLGHSVVEDIWHRFATRPADEDYSEFEGQVTSQEIEALYQDQETLLARYTPSIEEDSPRLFHTLPAARNHIPGTSVAGLAETGEEGFIWANGPFRPLLRAKLRTLYREAENLARASLGLPFIGEGWVSEVILLRELQEAFSDERVLHQGRPTWLGRQSYDVWFPERKIAIEYQGIQHIQPVERFGGGEAFIRQQARDNLKRELSEANGVELIEVHPNYTLTDVISEIEAILDRKSTQPNEVNGLPGSE